MTQKGMLVLSAPLSLCNNSKGRSARGWRVASAPAPLGSTVRDMSGRGRTRQRNDSHLRWLRRSGLALLLAGSGWAGWSLPATFDLRATSLAALLSLLGTRAAIHTRLPAHRRLGKLYRTERRTILFIGLSAIAALTPLGWLRGVGYTSLLAFAGFYRLLNAAISTVRDESRQPSGTDWLRQRRVLGSPIEDLARHDAGQGSELGRRWLGIGQRRPGLPAGATIAGVALTSLLLSTAVAESSAFLTESVKGATSRRHVLVPSQQPEPRRAIPIRETYDVVCRDAPLLEPGADAPMWAATALHADWLGPRGVGAKFGGCVTPARVLRLGNELVAYQIGFLGGSLRSVGIVWRNGPSTYYLLPAAARLVADIERGRPPMGPNLAIVRQ